MSTALKPVRDCGPEFGRRFEAGLRADLRTAQREATRRFSARLLEIGRDCDRFDRAEAIQHECDRLLALSSTTEEDTMSLDCPAPAPVRRLFSAPHPLHEAEPARAARRVEGASRPAPSAHPCLTAASDTARAIVEATALAAGMAAILIWACVFAGRV